MIHRLRYAFTVCVLITLTGCDYFRGVPERIQRAEQLLSQSQFRSAAIELKNVIEKEPNNPQARLMLAEIAVHMADPQSAQRDLEIARAQGADAARVNDVEIRVLLAIGKYEGALSKLNDATYVLAEPRRSLYAARANMGVQRYAAALELFTSVSNADAKSRDAELGAIEARAALGEVDAALQQLQEILQREPTNAQAWSLQGMLQARRGLVEQALASFDNAHRHADKQLTVKQHADVLSMSVELQLGRRNVAGAEQALANLNKVLPGTLMTRLLQSRIAVVKQDYPAAAAELQRIVRAAPDVAPAQFLLGMVLLQQNNINQAEQHLSRAVALAPQHLEARKLLAQAQLRLDRPQAAIQSLMPALDDPGVDLQIHGLLGLAEKQAGLESNSIDYLRQALAEQPQNDNRRLELATAYVRASKYDEAITLLRGITDTKLEAQRAAMLAAALARTKGPASARAELESQLARSPKNMALLGVVADFYGQSGQPQRGIDLLSTALRDRPHATSLLISRARLLTMRGDVTGAERDLKAALAQNESDRNVLMALADLAYRRGDVSSSMSWLERMSKAEPDSIQIELLKARVLLSAKQPAAAQQATELLNKLVLAHSERSDIRSAVARLYVSAGRYEEALAQLRAAAAIAKQDSAIQLEIARTQVALSQFDDARATVAELVRQSPTLLPAVAMASWLDIERGANDAAVARIAALRKQQPNDARVAAAEGEILMAAARPGPAAQSFESAFRTQPSIDMAMKTYLARTAARLPEPAGLLQSYVEKFPHDAAARGALAQAYQQQGDARRAIAQYEALTSDGIASPVVLNNLAWLYSEAGDARALPVARQAAALAPNSPAVIDTLGWILVNQGQYAEAVTVLRSAAGASKDAEIGYHYGVALAKSGAVDDSRRVIEEALRQTGPFPSRADAERLLKELSNGATAKAPTG
jgi:putative PEP-CTERM system TPR-repeat lipoprotein